MELEGDVRECVGVVAEEAEEGEAMAEGIACAPAEDGEVSEVNAENESPPVGSAIASGLNGAMTSVEGAVLPAVLWPEGGVP